VARPTDLLLSLPQGSLVVSSSVSFALRLTKINSLALLRFWSGLSCSVLVIHSSGFYPGESRASWKSWLSLLSLLSPLPSDSHPGAFSLAYLSVCLSVCLSFIASVSQSPTSHLVHPWDDQPSPVPYTALLCSSTRHPPQQFASVAWVRRDCTSQPATGATREESHFGRLSKFSDRRRGRIALQIGTVSEASPHPPSPGYPITQPSQPAIIPPPKGPV
jgi:hypothetical protein